MTKMMRVDYPVHAVIRPTRKALNMQAGAISCHISQILSQPDRSAFLFKITNLLIRRTDYFIRDYPPPGRLTEKDLFEGIPQ
jgi:hypothetical protein